MGVVFVEPLPLPLPPPPPVPPPEPEQLTHMPVKTASRATSRTALRNLRSAASGNRRMRPHRAVRVILELEREPRCGFGRAGSLSEPVVWLVVMSTVSAPVEPAVTLSVAGVEVQPAYCGRVPHWKAKLAEVPPSGVMLSA